MVSASASATFAAPQPPSRYHPVLAVLHWLLAVLTIAVWAQGSFLLKHLPNTTPDKVNVLRVHMLVGGAVLLLTLIRVAVTIITLHPPAAFPRSVLLSRLPRAVHVALHLPVLSMAATGIWIAVAAGLPAFVFGGAGRFPVTFDGLPPRALHGLIAKLMIVIVASHIVAASYHQFISKDGLMRRM